VVVKEKFDDTKGVIRIHTLKDRQCNGPKKYKNHEMVDIIQHRKLKTELNVCYMIKLYFSYFLVHSQYNVIKIDYIGEDSISW